MRRPVVRSRVSGPRALRAAGLLCAGVALAGGGCSFTPDLGVDPAADAIRTVKLHDGRAQLHIAIEEDGVTYRALLEERTRPGAVGAKSTAPRVFRLVEHGPPGTPIGWLFPLLSPSFDLEVDGRVSPHPDRQQTKELLRLANGTPPAVQAVLAGLERLQRVESRATLLGRLAGRKGMSMRAVDELLDVVAAGPKGALFGPGPGGRAPGGARSPAMLAVLEPLAGRRDIGTARADRIAGLAPSLQRDLYEGKLLTALVRSGEVSTGAVLKAVESIEEPPQRARVRRDVLMAIATRGGLTVADASAAVRACPSMQNDGYEVEVIARLRDRGASIEAVLDAVEGISGSGQAPSLREKLLLPLIQRKSLRPAEGSEIARRVPRTQSDAREAALLLALVARGRGTTATIIDAVGSIDEATDAPDLRSKVLTALAARRGRERAEADAIAAAVPGVKDDAKEAALLLRLVTLGEVGAEAIIDSVEELDESSAAPTLQRDVLLALVALRGGEQADADRIAAATGKIAKPEDAAKVLAALLLRRQVTTEAFIDAVIDLQGSSSTPVLRRDLLLALTELRGGERIHADRIAAASPKIDRDDLEAGLLLALLGKGQVATAAVIDACGAIDVSSSASKHRRDVLLALAKRRGGGREDGSRIAAACPAIENDAYEAEVLGVLVRGEQTPVEDILDAAESIDVHDSAPRHLSGVLLGLASRVRLSPEDAALVARATPGVDSDPLEGSVLIKLAGRAPRADLETALEAIQPEAIKRRVVAAFEKAPR